MKTDYEEEERGNEMGKVMMGLIVSSGGMGKWDSHHMDSSTFPRLLLFSLGFWERVWRK